MPFHRTLEMSLSREEFFRLLPAAVATFDVEGDVIRWADRGRGCSIRLTPLTDRLAGSAALPRHRVDIILEARREDEGEAFMARFHQAFLRGGG